MNEYKKYVKEWQDLCIKMNEAMQKNNFPMADRLLNEVTETYNRYKECCSYPESNKKKTFGELNYMLESELPNLFKANKKALKECTSLMKEDKNLRSAFRFLSSLSKYNCDGDVRPYVTESLELASVGIDKKTFRESVEKLADLLSKYEIGKNGINEEMRKYFESCEKVLLEEKKLANLNDYTNSVNTIISYVESHKQPVTESVKTIEKISEELEKKIANLTEEERSLVQDIIDFKKPMIETRQEKLFNHFKNECIETINKLSENADSEEVEGLKAIKEQLEKKSYCKETIVQDMAKLLEIRDILMEK